MKLEEIRKHFEDWYQMEGISNWSLRFEQDGSGDYVFAGTQKCWRAYQAAVEMMSKVNPPT